MNHLYYNCINADTLFVLESPHCRELESDYPCMGCSGENMSRVLFNGEETPFGRLMRNRDPRVASYAIFETFNFPLGLSDRINDTTQHQWTQLKRIEESEEYSNANRVEKYRLLINDILTRRTDSVWHNYSNEIASTLNTLTNLRRIVVCGFIAQSMFLEKYQIADIPYNRIYEWLGEFGNFDLIFTNHPRNTPWDYEQIRE